MDPTLAHRAIKLDSELGASHGFARAVGGAAAPAQGDWLQGQERIRPLARLQHRVVRNHPLVSVSHAQSACALINPTPAPSADPIDDRPAPQPPRSRYMSVRVEP